MMTLPRDVNATRAESFEDALRLLFVDSYNTKLNRYRSDFVFRGLSDARYEMLTSLQRLGGDFARLERSILRNFWKYAERSAYSAPHSTWHQIAIAQHHGLPTRLLDWTWSPTVALHFATSELGTMSHDGRIWCLDLDKTFDLQSEAFQNTLRREYAFVATVEMLDQLAPDLPSFDGLTAPDRPILQFFEPPSIDQRIVNQYALFSVMSNAEARVEEWLSEHPTAWRAVDIPASIKWEIRDKLDSMNLNERVLFPGLDGLAAWLRRHYSPGGCSRKV